MRLTNLAFDSTKDDLVAHRARHSAGGGTGPTLGVSQDEQLTALELVSNKTPKLVGRQVFPVPVPVRRRMCFAIGCPGHFPCRVQETTALRDEIVRRCQELAV